MLRVLESEMSYRLRPGPAAWAGLLGTPIFDAFCFWESERAMTLYMRAQGSSHRDCDPVLRTQLQDCMYGYTSFPVCHMQDMITRNYREPSIPADTCGVDARRCQGTM